MTYIVGGFCIALLLMGIVFTIIALVGANENSDMMDTATIGYVFAVICLIIFGIRAGSGYMMFLGMNIRRYICITRKSLMI